MPTSTKVVNQLANTVTKRLTNTGGRATLDALINDVTNTTGELRMLVRHAARKAILNGAIVRVRHARRGLTRHRDRDVGMEEGRPKAH